MRPEEVGAGEICRAKVSAFEMRFAEVGTFQMRPVETRAFEMSPVEACALEIRVVEAGAFEMRLIEAGVFEMRLGEVGAAKVCQAQVQAPFLSRLMLSPRVSSTPDDFQNRRDVRCRLGLCVSSDGSDSAGIFRSRVRFFPPRPFANERRQGHRNRSRCCMPASLWRRRPRTFC